MSNDNTPRTTFDGGQGGGDAGWAIAAFAAPFVLSGIDKARREGRSATDGAVEGAADAADAAAGLLMLWFGVVGFVMVAGLAELGIEAITGLQIKDGAVAVIAFVGLLGCILIGGRRENARRTDVVAAASQARQQAPGSHAAGRAPMTTTRSTTTDTVAFLLQAVRERRQVWLGYVDEQGRATSRVVEPHAVDGGYVTACDHLRQEDRTFALHRITGVAEVVQ
jgi:hypothetical protein